MPSGGKPNREIIDKAFQKTQEMVGIGSTPSLNLLHDYPCFVGNGLDHFFGLFYSLF
jgi:hypothetical protein